MNAAALLAQYARIADAPDAVERMRQLVLNLSIRGKLTNYSVNQQDVYQLGDVSEFVMGQAPPGSSCNTVGDGTIFVKVGEFGDRFPRTEVWTTEPLKRARVGDVLICVVGATIGKLNLGIDCAIGRSVAAIRPQPIVDQVFLYYSLMPVMALLREGARGSAQGVISRPDLAAIKIWAPPLAEQHRIVAKVDELMALCDRLEAAQLQREATRDRLAAASLARLNTPDPETSQADARFAIGTALPALTTRPDQIKQLRQTILELAMRGTLTSASSELPETRVADSSPTSRETPVPVGWRWLDFGDVVTLENGDRGKNYPNRDEYVSAGIPWINTGHIEPDGSLSLARMHFITRSKFDSLRGGKIRPGDLVYCLRGATFGKTAFVEPFDEGAVASSLMIVRPGPAIDRRYAYFFLTSPIGRRQLLRFDNGTAQPNLSSGNVKKYRIPLPPLAEQNRIVRKIDELMALCDQLESSLTHGENTRSRLLNTLLHEALAPAERELEAA